MLTERALLATLIAPEGHWRSGKLRGSAMLLAMALAGCLPPRDGSNSGQQQSSSGDGPVAKAAPSASAPSPSDQLKPTDVAIVRVDTVLVASTNADGKHWDDVKPFPDTYCEVVDYAAVAASAAGPKGKIVGEAAKIGCRGYAAYANGKVTWEYPDVQLMVSAGVSQPYKSAVALNTTSADFAALQQQFVVPLAALNNSDLRITVVDNDNEESPGKVDTIGVVRLTQADIISAFNNSRGEIRRANQNGVREMSIQVLRYQQGASLHPLDTRRGLAEAEAIIAAGEALELVVTGSYQTSDGPCGPAGRPDEASVEDEGFKVMTGQKEGKGGLLAGSRFGSAYALIGSGPRQILRPSPCTRGMAIVAGTVDLGVNTAKPETNNGTLTFEIRRRAPTVDEWIGGRTPASCGP